MTEQQKSWVAHSKKWMADLSHSYLPATILLFSITCFAKIWFSWSKCSLCFFSAATFFFRVEVSFSCSFSVKLEDKYPQWTLKFKQQLQQTLWYLALNNPVRSIIQKFIKIPITVQNFIKWQHQAPITDVQPLNYDVLLNFFLDYTNRTMMER